MSTIDKLLLRGVRSVGCGDNEEQVIEFLKPLTIISGPNGTGKTTIIEALNFVTTGAMPSGKYNSFIHSLEVAKRQRVDGLVKLQFTDPKKRTCVVTKRMSASLQKGKLKCGADESNIQIQNNGVVKSLSSKVVDFHTEVLNLLSVPPAILENVIFCHQEDSCWPLSEPKELKNRFDRIFQLTKFVKALEQMKKLKKDYETESKLLQEKRNNAEIYLERKLEYTEILETSSATRADSAKRLEELKQTIKRCDQVITESNERLVLVGQEERRADILRAELHTLTDQRGRMNTVRYAGPRCQLEMEIAEAKSTNEFVSAAREKSVIDNQLRSFEDVLRSLNEEIRNRESHLVMLKSSLMNRDSMRRDMDQMGAKLCDKWSFLPDVDAGSQILNAIEENREAFNDIRVEAESKRAECQVEVDAIQTKLSGAEAELRSIENSAEKSETEAANAEQKLRQASSSQSRLEDISQQLAYCEQELARFPVLKESNIRLLREKRDQLNNSVDDLRRRFLEAEKYQDAEKEVQRKTDELSGTEQRLKALFDTHKQDLEDIFGHGVIGPWGPKMNQETQRLRPLLMRAEAYLVQAEKENIRLQQSVSSLTEEKTKTEKEVENLESRINETCGCSSGDVSNQLSEIRLALKRARKELAPLSTKAELYERWSHESQKKGCCPLCDRKFQDKKKSAEFANKLMDVSMSMPDEVNRLTLAVLEFEEKERSLAGAMALVDQMEKLQTITVSDIESRLAVLRKESSENEHKCAVLTKEKLQFNEKYQTIQRVEKDVSLMDSLHQTAAHLNEELKLVTSRLPSSGTGDISATQLKQLLAKEEESLKSVRDEYETVQQQSEQKNTVKTKIIALRDERVSLDETAGQTTHLQELVRERKKEATELRKRANVLRNDVPFMKRQLERAKASREDCDAQAQSKAGQIEITLRELQLASERWHRLQKDLADTENVEQQLKEADGLLAGSRRRGQELENKKSALLARSTDIEASLYKEARVRSLEQQLTLLIMEETIEEKTRRLEECHQKAAEGSDTLRERALTASAERERSIAERARIAGQMEEVEKKCREAKTVLMRSEMKNAEKVYRDAVVDVVVVQETIADMRKYMMVLDDSILKFHTEKMVAINDILEELWRKVYKGTDIDTIRIKSEIAGSDKRQTYDYRVVMVLEGGIEMDMRDRCSAGQKMLASILIRIALADVFSGLCSIIALDEPTTNLDIQKVEHMAEMLNDLIAARRDEDSQTTKQFQMIVITHDDRLVERLTLSNRPEWHYVLNKDEKGVSHIKRKMQNGFVLWKAIDNLGVIDI